MDFEQNLVALIPPLRAFAGRLCVSSADAEDLMQDALVKALGSRSMYRPGSNLKAWAFTIMHNQRRTQQRRAWRTAPLTPETLAQCVEAPRAEGIIALAEVGRALSRLSSGEREALVLVAAAGFSYQEAASAQGVSKHTVKARISRARNTLTLKLGDRS